MPYPIQVFKTERQLDTCFSSSILTRTVVRSKRPYHLQVWVTNYKPKTSVLMSPKMNWLYFMRVHRKRSRSKTIKRQSLSLHAPGRRYRRLSESSSKPRAVMKLWPPHCLRKTGFQSLSRQSEKSARFCQIKRHVNRDGSARRAGAGGVRRGALIRRFRRSTKDSRRKTNRAKSA